MSFQTTDYLKPDKRWAMQNLVTIEDYTEKYIEPIHLIPEVHDDVHCRIENVKRILFFAYYEYELLDVAYEHLLLTLELALKLRYEDIEELPSSKNRKGLKALLAWASEHELLEFPERRKSIEGLRNFYAHPRRYSMSGIAGIGLIHAVPNTINYLYRTP